jgi:hypothetical protein
MPANLSNTSEIAEEKTNIPGTKSPILSIQPEDGTGLIIDGMVENGEAKGFPLYGKLFAKDGSEMPLDTDLAFQFESPGDDDPTTVTYPFSNIRPYRTLDVDQQMNDEQVDAVKHVIKRSEQALAEGNMPQIAIGHLDTLHVVAESGKTVDWDHPDTRLYLDPKAVTEV